MKHFLPLLFISLFLTSPANAIETAAQQAIVIDDTTGATLFEKNADAKMHPSSMSKLMTVYIAFSHLKDGSMKLTDTLPVSEKAWRTQGSKTFVEIGGRISVDDLLQGIIIQSGNDACVVVAEGLAGSEEAFADQMNATAQRLGLTNSHFANATGLPNDAHLMSARDLAILAQHIIHDFPEYYHYFSQKEFVHHGIKQGNRNLLLYGNNGDLTVDGLKTGHTDAGGFGMTASAKDKTERRVIVVVNGLRDDKARAQESRQLLDYGFRNFDDVTLVKKGAEIGRAQVWFGKTPDVALTSDRDVIVTLPRARAQGKMKYTLAYDGPLQAPVKEGAEVAQLRIESPDAPAQVVPLVAAQSVEKVGGFAKLWRNLRLLVTGK